MKRLLTGGGGLAHFPLHFISFFFLILRAIFLCIFKKIEIFVSSSFSYYYYIIRKNFVVFVWMRPIKPLTNRAALVCWPRLII
jgi:hypothetical protein